MTIFLLVLLVIAIGALIQQQRYRKRLIMGAAIAQKELVVTNRKTLQAYQDLYKNYQALEEGNQEIVDNYENDFLDLTAKVEASQNAAKYDREKREEAEKKLSQWDEAIRKHADHCDTILKEMVDVMMEDILPPSE